MRLIKMLGLAAMTALAAMAFVGASSASAETNTTLCLSHSGLECKDPVPANALLHAVLDPTGPYGTSGLLLNSTANVLCLGVLATLLAGGGLAEPPAQYDLKTDTEHKIVYTGCGTTSTHNNCTIEETQGALLLLLKTGLDHGTLKSDGGKTHVHCKEVTIFKILINCTYDGTGLEFLVGEGKLHADKTAVNIIKEESEFFCPAESALDGLLELLPYELAGGTKHEISILE